MAKFGIALEWGSRGRWVESSHSDQKSSADRKVGTGFFFFFRVTGFERCVQADSPVDCLPHRGPPQRANPSKQSLYAEGGLFKGYTLIVTGFELSSDTPVACRAPPSSHGATFIFCVSRKCKRIQSLGRDLRQQIAMRPILQPIAVTVRPRTAPPLFSASAENANESSHSDAVCLANRRIRIFAFCRARSTVARTLISSYNLIKAQITR